MAAKTGIQKAVKLSDEMAEFMGKSAASRADITKAIWAHIKKHKLQDPNNRRTVLFDDTLGDLLGKSQATMFQIPGLITQHVVK